MSRTGISIRVAARWLFEADYTFKQVNDILNWLNKPTNGYVYADDITDLT